MMNKSKVLKLLFGMITSLMWLPVVAQQDSITLTYREYLDNIFNYHPIAKKADLRLQLAKVEALGAKGNLDPMIAADWEQKNFDDKLYYRQYQAKFNIPTRLGIDFSGGYENTNGIYLNPEAKTNDFGLWHVGIEANILQGLVVNERKTAIELAEIFQDLAKNEQQIILNELIYNASSVYLIWQQYYFFSEVLTENIAIADTYFQNTKQSFFSGEKTAMDTLEALILYQDAITHWQKNELGVIEFRQNVENYLWFEDVPITLQSTTQPENYNPGLLTKLTDFEGVVLSAHPVILAAINKLSMLEIEQKLKREKLKPKLKIKYNPLLATRENNIAPRFSINDYKWGFDFSVPLLRRGEKADVQRGEIKMRETQLELQNKRNELQNKIESSWLQQNLIGEQLVILRRNVDGYRRLLDGENEKFRFGESSVFLLNKRQEKYIDGRLKLIETFIKQQIELLNFLYFSNQLLDD